MESQNKFPERELTSGIHAVGELSVPPLLAYSEIMAQGEELRGSELPLPLHHLAKSPDMEQICSENDTKTNGEEKNIEKELQKKDNKELSVINAHDRDKRIKFYEPTHTYYIDGDSNYISVTTWIHSFFPHFDPDIVIEKMRKGRNWNKDNKYFNMTTAEIKNEWDRNGKEASSLGTQMHLNIENYYNGIPFAPDFIGTPEYKHFNDFLRDHQDYKPYRTEWTLFSEEFKLAGSADIIMRKTDNPDKLIIGDWKRSKEIKGENKYEKGYPPLSHLDNCNLNHYALQLNIYRHLLETYYSKSICEMFLLILYPQNYTYQKIIIPRIETEVQMMFASRKMKLNSNKSFQ